MARRLIFDTSNILFRVHAASSKKHVGMSPEDAAAYALHSSLLSMNKYVKQYQPDEIAATFEGGKNWRKTYTLSENCKSGKLYKGNRVRDESMKPFIELVQSFEELARQHSNILCLGNPLLEGDDLFGGYVQRYASVGDEVIGISGDKDFVQLLKYPSFKLINPDDGKARSVEGTCGVSDPEYFMFEKAIRGDSGDNVGSAFPRVRKTVIQKAYSDEYARSNLMNETWSITDQETGVVKEYRVGDLFEENLLLMSLEHQPNDIKQLINEAIDESYDSRGKFSHFKFVGWCGKHGLNKVGENAMQFTGLFAAQIKAQPIKSNSLLEF